MIHPNKIDRICYTGRCQYTLDDLNTRFPIPLPAAMMMPLEGYIQLHLNNASDI